MTAATFDTTLNVLADRKPFRPFVVQLNTGEKYEVDHPKALVNRDGVAVFILPGGTPVLFDHESVSQFIAELSGASG